MVIFQPRSPAVFGFSPEQVVCVEKRNLLILMAKVLSGTLYTIYLK